MDDLVKMEKEEHGERGWVFRQGFSYIRIQGSKICRVEFV